MGTTVTVTTSKILPFLEPGLRFDGELDDFGVSALVFAYQVRQHIERLNELIGPFSERQKIRDFGFRLGRTPKLWYNGVLKLARAKELELTFLQLLELFRQRYHPDNYDELIKEKLIEMHQGRRDPEEYIDDFLSQYRQFGGSALDAETICKYFINGLHPSLRLPLEERSFDDIDDLMSMVLRRWASF